MIFMAGMRIFRGSTLFLAGVGVGSVATVAIVGYTIDQHGEKILAGLQDLKEIVKDLDTSVSTSTDVAVVDIPIDGTATEESETPEASAETSEPETVEQQ